MSKNPTWTAEKICWPWSLDRFTGTKGDKVVVLENLANRNFEVKRLAATPPEPRLVRACEKLLVDMLVARDAGRVPWVLLLSESPPALQAIATLAPLGYSLTTMAACEITSTSKLMDLFFDKKPMDVFDDDVPGELLHQLQVAGFLSWMDVNLPAGGSHKQAGRFGTLLEHRHRYLLPTLLTASYVDWKGDTWAKVIHQIDSTLGTGAAALIRQEAQTVKMKTQAAERELLTLEI